MDFISILIKAIGWISLATTFIVVVEAIVVVCAWINGILPALIRLGNGLSRRKIAIFAKGDNLGGLKNLLEDSKLFKKKNIIDISSEGDFGRAERATLFLVFWQDWQDKITEILNAKKGNTALIVYASEPRSIPDDKMKKLNLHPHTTIANMRGRLLNDIIISLIATSYK